MKRVIGLALIVFTVGMLIYQVLFAAGLLDIHILNIMLIFSVSLGFIPLAIIFIIGWFLFMDKRGDEKGVKV